MRLCVECRRPLNTREWQCSECGWRVTKCDGVTVLLRQDAKRGAAADGAVAHSFAPEQFRHLLSVTPEHFWLAARNRLIVWALRRFFPAARTFLDVGCGTGHVARALSEAIPTLSITASEAALAGLREAARVVPDADLVQADVMWLPYDSEFDVVGVFDVIEHIPDHDTALREIGRAAASGGGVLITVPQHPKLWSSLDTYSGHQRRYTRDELLSLVARAGLEVVYVTSFVTLLLPAVMASRLTQGDVPVDPMREFHISPVLNRMGAAVMAIEHRLIAAGLSFGVGSSLLVVARKP
jgi:ubiquinone/menaquinone biosynthesis C-methylase UbiE